jgi:hypothetical protein
MNPITNDPARARCGGAIVRHGDHFYRPAQDGSRGYGGNLSLMRIDELSTAEYRESLAKEALFDRLAPWRSAGAHHLSMAEFGGRTILAVDGKQPDYWINRPLSGLFRLISNPARSLE